MHAFEATIPPLREDTDGVLRVGNTRVTLESIVIAFDMGATAEEIAHRYAALDIATIYEVIAYVLRHRPAVDDYLAARQEKAAEARVEVEKRFPPDGIRARLLARRSGGVPDVR